MNAAVRGVGEPLVRIHVRRVPALRPFIWIGLATQDLLESWRLSFAHAGLMVAFGWVLLFMLGAHPYFLAAALSGFLLGAPVMTTGIVELSRRLEQGESTSFNESLAPLERDGPALVQFGGVLAVFAAAWFVVSGALLSAVLNVPVPDISDTFYLGFLTTVTRPQLISYIAVGAVLALLVFVLSVVAVPLMIDQHASAWQAMSVSVEVVRKNPTAMLVWSAVLVVWTATGFATMLFGMLIVIPLLGHATWHAYRELVRA
jgi:uncharacterized membrane protein